MPVPRDVNPPRLMLDEKSMSPLHLKQYKALWNKKYKALKAPKIKKVPGKKFGVPIPDKANESLNRKINKDLHLLYEDISKSPR